MRADLSPSLIPLGYIMSDLLLPSDFIEVRAGIFSGSSFGSFVSQPCVKRKESAKRINPAKYDAECGGFPLVVLHGAVCLAAPNFHWLASLGIVSFAVNVPEKTYLDRNSIR